MSVEKNLSRVASDLHRLRTAIVNVYFWGEPVAGNCHWVLVDAGLPGSGDEVVAAATHLFGADVPPAAVVLTHGHFDHIGALPVVRKKWMMPIYAHALEMPHLTGQMDYPPPDPSVGGGMMARLSRLYPRRAVDLRPAATALRADGSIAEMPGWRWIHTPGHTAGHVSLFRNQDRLLLAGDAVVTVRQESLLAVLRQKPEVRPPPAYFTTDWAAAYTSLSSLRSLSPHIAATGHGPPMEGEALARGWEKLDREFGRIGVPRHGRYVDRTWRIHTAQPAH